MCNNEVLFIIIVHYKTRMSCFSKDLWLPTQILWLMWLQWTCCEKYRSVILNLWCEARVGVPLNCGDLKTLDYMFLSYSYDPLDPSLVCQNAIYLYAVKLFVTSWIGKKWNIYFFFWEVYCALYTCTEVT